MKKTTSRKLLHLMFEIGAALDQSTALVRDRESDADFKKYRATVGKLMADMLDEVINPICRNFPELKPRQLYLESEKIPRAARKYRHRGIPAPRLTVESRATASSSRVPRPSSRR